MGRSKGLIDFLPQRNELIDVEETPPIDFVAGHAPPCQAVMLTPQDGGQAALVLYRLGGEREELGEITQGMAAGGTRYDGDLASLDCFPQRLAENWQQDLATAPIPIDVEKASVAA